MSYSIPVYNARKRPQTKEDLNYQRLELETVLDKTIIISQLSEGGITYSDCENMDLYEFEYLCKKMISLKKEENKIRERQIEEAKKKNKSF